MNNFVSIILQRVSYYTLLDLSGKDSRPDSGLSGRYDYEYHRAHPGQDYAVARVASDQPVLPVPPVVQATSSSFFVHAPLSPNSDNDSGCSSMPGE